MKLKYPKCPACGLDCESWRTLVSAFIAFVAILTLGLLFSGCYIEIELPQSHAIRVVWSDGARSFPGYCAGVTLPAYAGKREEAVTRLRQWLAPFDANVFDVDASAIKQDETWLGLASIVVASGGAEMCGDGTPGLGWGMSPIGTTGGWTVIWSTGENADNLGNLMAHELGHSVGALGHVDDDMQVMRPKLQSGLTPPYDDAWRTNEQGGQQNAWMAMMNTLGKKK